MRIFQSGHVCVNGEHGGSINRALSRQWWDKVTIKRLVNSEKSHAVLTINLSGLSHLEKSNALNLSLYFPETNRSVKRTIPGNLEADIFSLVLDASLGRYANVLILDNKAWIHYANTIVLVDTQNIVYNDSLVVSKTTAVLQSFQLDDERISLSIVLSEPLSEVNAFLQSVHGVITIPVQVDTRNVILDFTELSRLKPEMWMLLVADADKKYLAQICFSVFDDHISETKEVFLDAFV